MVPRPVRLLVLLALFVGSLPRAGAAAPPASVVFDFAGTPAQDGVPPPWSYRRWSPVVSLGDYVAEARVVEHAGQKVLRVTSHDSGFLVGRKLQVDVGILRHVTWGWLAETLPAGASFTKRATNDQALQLLFGFAGGKVVGYLWDTRGPVGATGSGLSWREDVRVIVLQAGPANLGRWLTEERDLYQDFVTLFGQPPPSLVGVAVQSNSQHTGTHGAGLVGPIRLSP